ncbi:MAG: radical SAM protein [Minisyncoccia bacterium]
MKIVFIQPKTIFGNTWEALNIGYMSAYLKSKSYPDIGFFSGFFDSDEEIIKGCQDADIIGFSCTSPQMKHGIELAKKIKNKKNWIVFGGVHPSVLPEDVIETFPVDAVVVGEGEDAMLKIAQGNRRKILKMPYIQNLDSLPFPNRVVIKQERNIAQAFKDNGIRIASIFSSRGCPFQCAFCASHCVWTRYTRFRSVENVLDEVEQIVNDLKIDFVKFSDDTFGVRKDWMMQFCKDKILRGIDTPFGCNIRVNTVDEETLEWMKKAGCKEVWVGVESGSPKILKDMKKGITVDKVRWAFDATKKIGLFRRAYVLLGMPNESMEDIKMTESLIDEIQPDMVGFTILAPYPGTEFYNPAIHKNVDWSLVDEYGNGLIRTKYLTNDELKTEQIRLVEKYRNIITYRQSKK